MFASFYYIIIITQRKKYTRDKLWITFWKGKARREACGRNFSHSLSHHHHHQKDRDGKTPTKKSQKPKPKNKKGRACLCVGQCILCDKLTQPKNEEREGGRTKKWKEKKCNIPPQIFHKFSKTAWHHPGDML